MGAGGSLAPAGLLWLCLAPAALLRLHQPQPILAVEPGGTVEIRCEASEDMESKGNVLWYRRSGRDEPNVVVDCQSRKKERYSCVYGGHNVTLLITRTRPEDTGLYLCACRSGWYLEFGNGTALLVGDSWRNGTWVRVLALPRAPRAPRSLLCAVGAAAGPVLVSWIGGAWGMLGLGGAVEPLVSPMGTAAGGRGLCEVRFNASGPPVRRSVELRGATGCSFLSPRTVVPAGVGALLLLGLCLSIYRLRRPAHTGRQPGTPVPPASQEDEGELRYARLNFAAPARRGP